MGPHGLGHLVACNYLAEANVLYCPTADGMPTWWTGIGVIEAPIRSAHRLAHLQQAGGTSAKDIMYGDWEMLGRANRLPDFQGHVVQSHYSYRLPPSYLVSNVASNRMYGSIPQPDTELAPGDADNQIVRVLYTQPDRVVTIGEPIFKTQKMLGDRAIVSDAFSQSALVYDIGPGGGNYGAGIFAHRDGYNVLYGDYHAEWWGDPHERLIFQPRVYISYPYWGTGGNHIMDYVWHEGLVDEHMEKNGTSILIWHNFDVSAGVDVGVDD